jgi:mono/diheme cytochrome c family protein
MFKKQTLFATVVLLLALALTACGGDSTPAQTGPGNLSQPAGDAVAGQQLYQQSCSACHGLDGTGVTGLGKDLVHSDFMESINDAELLAFIKQGRPVSDPANTTGVDMPPKGGNPALSDGQIVDIIAYLRSIAQ